VPTTIDFVISVMMLMLHVATDCEVKLGPIPLRIVILHLAMIVEQSEKVVLLERELIL